MHVDWEQMWDTDRDNDAWSPSHAPTDSWDPWASCTADTIVPDGHRTPDPPLPARPLHLPPGHMVIGE